MATEPITGLTYQEANSLQTDVLQNAELNYFSVWANTICQSVNDTTPPVSPNAGDCYAVGIAATGDWAGHDNTLAVYRDSVWQFYTPREGVVVMNLADNSQYRSLSGVWSIYSAGGGGGTSGIPFYFEQSASSDISGYKKAISTPSLGSEVSITQANTGTSDTLIVSLATDTGQPGAIVYPAGITTFHIHASTSASNEYCRLKLELYKRTTGGTETKLVEGYSDTFVGTAQTELDVQIASSEAFVLDITDRLVFKIYTARVSGATTATATVYFEGTSHTAYVSTTVVAGGRMPAGGTTGQHLAKASNNDYDTEWVTPSAGSSLDAVTALTNSAGTVTVDCSLGKSFTITLAANVTTLTLTNLSGSGYSTEIEIEIKQNVTGGYTFALPASFKALGGSDTAIASAANAVTVLSAKTFDNGTTWRYAMQESA